jgi:nucleotide-binding universal stress UspA family protein
MTMKKILVPLDGSPTASEALPMAMSLARRSNAALCLISVASGGSGDLGIGDTNLYLEEMASSLAFDGFAACTHTGTGATAQSIVDTATNEKVDMIVMTTRGRSGITRGILGSVTDAVISHATVPVYVVRSNNAPRVSVESENNSGVIVPLDGSELSESALDTAIQMAELSAAPIYLLRVVNDALDIGNGRIAKAYLDQISEQLAKRKVLAIPLLMSGHAGASIIQTMEARPGSVVVMTSRGAGGVTRWVRGSVADWLIQRAPGPIVVVANKREALLGSVIH